MIAHWQLLIMVNETSVKRKKDGMNSLAKMRELLDDKDLDKILASSKKFRKEFKLR
jgi:hypothetical protein